MTSAEMYPLIRQWQSSGQSKTAFCVEHNIKLHTFYYWEQKYRKETAGSIQEFGQFVELQINTSEEQDSGKLTMSCPNGVCLKFEVLPSSSFLGALLKAI